MWSRSRRRCWNYWSDRQSDRPDATVELNRTTLDRMILGQTTVDPAITNGTSKAEGDAAKFGQFVALLDAFELCCGVVTS